MSIIVQIPQKARSIPVSVPFNAGIINNPGVYDFSTNAFNLDYKLHPLSTNSVYLVSSYTISGNIAESDFITNIDGNNKITLTLKRDNGKDTIMVKPITVYSYHEAEDLNLWVFTQKGNDFLTASLSGIVFQNGNMIGLSHLVLSVGFQIWEISETDFNTNFVNKTGKNFFA